MERSHRALTVRARRNTDRIAVANAGDFVCAASSGTMLKSPLPYCLDFVRARALYATDIDADRVQSAPFYYLYRRQRATRLLSVPIEHGRISRAPTQGDPVFLFSPGRCGSTMLSRILAEAGVPSVSEPDFYTQMAAAFWSSPLNPARSPFLSAMWNMSDDLAVALGAAPVVKLRAECARAPDLFVRKRSARTLVMFRRFEDWARSTAKVFGAGPGKAVRKYLTAARCYARLSRISHCFVLRYEDWTEDPEGAAARLGAFLGVTIPPVAAWRAMAGNSQEGTPLSGRNRPGWPAKFDAAMRLWQSPRLVGARARLEVPALWD